MPEVILIGGFHEIIELAEESLIKIIGIIDSERSGHYYGYPILCNDKNAINLKSIYRKTPVIITPDIPKKRLKLYEHYNMLKFEFSSLTSNKANISKSSHIEIGTIVQFGVNISAEVTIGKFVKLNTLCNIMHNTSVGDFTTIAPNAVILGNIKIGKACYIGANSTILPNIEICDNTIIGAGAVVTKSILCQGVYAGIPAIKVRGL